MQNRIKFVKYDGKYEYPITGAKMEDADLEGMLVYCRDCLPIKGEKHKYGSIFIYDEPVLGIKDNSTSTGIIFIDIDYINKETADKIFNNFSLLMKQWPSLLAIQFSSSYYDESKEKNGLHIYISSPILTSDVFSNYARICMAVFARFVLKLLDIDLRVAQLYKDGKPLNILDLHNTVLSQRFFLYHSDFKYNNYAEIFDITQIKHDDIIKLKKEYNFVFLPGERYRKERTINIKDFKGIENNIEKICIDRYFGIENFTGNDIRWRISRIAQALFGDKAQEWCDNYFYCGNGDSIYTHQNSIEKLDPDILDWLTYNGYIINEKQPNIIRKGEYLEQYTSVIVNFINKHRRCEIVAPTGVGKTTFINGWGGEVMNFFSPDVYLDFSLAKKLNAIVLVPFIVTNRLYNNMIEISSENKNEIKDNEPAVMVWDQAVKHWDEIKDRTLIIDEAHCLFLDRTYRDAAIELLNNIKRDNSKVVLFTATPAGEAQVIDCDLLRFYGEREDIKTRIIKVTNIDRAEYNYINKALEKGYYDKIVLFDDINAKKIYEKIYVDGKYIFDTAYIRAATKNSEDFIELRENERLNKRLTICTCVAFNGLNFKNENERILVVTSAYNGNTTGGTIIQEAGRIRKSNVEVVIFYNDKDEKDSLEDQITKANEMNKAETELGLNEDLLDYNRRLLDDDVVDALHEIKRYNEQKANIEEIIKDLNDAGYFIIKRLDWTKPEDEKKGMTLALKKKMSDEFIEDIFNGKFLMNNYNDKEDNSYKAAWKKNIERTCMHPFFKGITIEIYKALINVTNKKNLISTIIDKVNNIIKICTISKDEWKQYENNIDVIANMLSNDIDKRDLRKNYKAKKKIREEYSEYVKIEKDELGVVSFNFSELNDMMIRKEQEKYNKEKEAKRICKEIRIVVTDKFKRADKYNLAIGQQFDSEKQLIEYSGKNKMAILRWKKKEWIKAV